MPKSVTYSSICVLLVYMRLKHQVRSLPRLLRILKGKIWARSTVFVGEEFGVLSERSGGVRMVFNSGPPGSGAMFFLLVTECVSSRNLWPEVHGSTA